MRSLDIAKDIGEIPATAPNIGNSALAVGIFFDFRPMSRFLLEIPRLISLFLYYSYHSFVINGRSCSVAPAVTEMTSRSHASPAPKHVTPVWKVRRTIVYGVVQAAV